MPIDSLYRLRRAQPHYRGHNCLICPKYCNLYRTMPHYRGMGHAPSTHAIRVLDDSLHCLGMSHVRVASVGGCCVLFLFFFVCVFFFNFLEVPKGVADGYRGMCCVWCWISRRNFAILLCVEKISNFFDVSYRTSVTLRALVVLTLPISCQKSGVRSHTWVLEPQEDPKNQMKSKFVREILPRFPA